MIPVEGILVPVTQAVPIPPPENPAIPYLSNVGYVLHRGDEAFEIVRASGAPEGSALRFDGFLAAESFLRSFLGDVWNGKTLRALLPMEYPGTGLHGLKDADVVRLLAPRLSKNYLRAVRRVHDGVVEGIAPAEKLADSPPAKPPKESVKEKTWIEFELLDEDGEPMAGEDYELCLPDGSVQKGKLDGQGLVRVSGIDPGLGTISWFLKPSKPKKGKGVVEKYDGGPPKIGKVTAIKVTVPRTLGKRDKTKSRGSDANWTTTSPHPSLTANPPKVIVCGTKDVLLEAVTDPPNQAVTWKVAANPAIGIATPSLLPYQTKWRALLKTDKHGSFSVSATLGGSKVVWNVAFLRVKVNAGSSFVHHRKDGYEDEGSDNINTSFKSGEFKKDEFAWDATVDVEVIGGGASEELGVGKVKLHLLQNGVACNLTGGYEPKDGLPGTALEVPKGGFPVLDASGASSPFAAAGSSFGVTPDNAGRKRKVFTGDSPLGRFPNSHEHTSKALKTIKGGQTFKAAIASTSDDAPGSIVVHAQIYWIANYPGLVSYGAGNVGTYHPKGAATLGQKKYELISPASGGSDAGEAGFETCEPRYNNGVDTHWSP